ncbi:piggyBac transposable element-derived protein 3-like [Teleopsis dalmanni]|uniref:piggyBac transposable element-derived protein 3-like n=1 Tax=Teleopsis dalmanni TaxID=139649 RepID=UPI0018CF0697|nr:piggyBac transposable element-derived protein 3-like [Teleopsis dalmanni]
MLVEETNRYAAQHNIAICCDKYLIQRFIGVLLFSGYHHVPNVKLYWSMDPAFGIPIIRQTMTRNTFLRLKSNFHIANNDTLSMADKFAKVRPLFKMLNERYIQFGVWAEHLSIDKTMVPYFGRRSAKMFIRGKPIRFGYKLWTLSSDSGYIFQFLPYSGATDKYDKQLGIGASVVMELLNHCEHPLQHTVHFDNFFTSHYLLCLLKERGFCASGKVRSNRIAGATLKTGKKLKGQVTLQKYESDFLYDKTNNILVVRWIDNSEVTIATNYDSVEPIVNVQRYSREKKKNICVPQPQVINSYNRHIGGVNLHDKGVVNYRIAIRGRKWWWPLWVQFLDSAVVNAWKLHCFAAASNNTKPMPLLDFKNFIARNLLLASEDSVFITEATVYDDLKKENHSASEDVYLPGNLPRVTGMHAPTKTRNRRRCIVCTPKATVFTCEKCNVHVHVENCFKTFHENKQYYIDRRQRRK